MEKISLKLGNFSVRLCRLGDKLYFIKSYRSIFKVFIIIYLIMLFLNYTPKTYASDLRIAGGMQIMGYIFEKYPDFSYLVKYRKDQKVIGVLLINPIERRSNILQIFDVNTGEVVFEYDQKDREITDFVFKKNAVILIYKSTFWQEKAAYDITSGKYVRRYSSWLANKPMPQLGSDAQIR